VESQPPCPACGEPLYGWLTIAGPGGVERLLRRCEHCGLGLAADLEPEQIPGVLLDEARDLGRGRLELRLANRSSVQARLGARHWAALGAERRLYPTPQSLPALAAFAGARVVAIASPQSRRAQGWMWQTLVNAFTLSENVARELRSRRLEASGVRARTRLVLDLAVTVLAALPVALVSAPLEAAAALTGRGGELAARVALPVDTASPRVPTPRSARPA
jgi:hypothetical protein